MTLAHAWTTVYLDYHVCDRDMTALINYDAAAKGVYGNSSVRSVGILSDNHPTDVVAELNGCTPHCQVILTIRFDDNDVSNITQLSSPYYFCTNSDYNFYLNVTMKIIYNGIAPDPKHPAPPSVTYDYCTKGLNIETGGKLDGPIT
ncbi:4785_t:CDS:1, partial [Paraglomus occultum]